MAHRCDSCGSECTGTTPERELPSDDNRSLYATPELPRRVASSRPKTRRRNRYAAGRVTPPVLAEPRSRPPADEARRVHAVINRARLALTRKEGS